MTESQLNSEQSSEALNESLSEAQNESQGESPNEALNEEGFAEAVSAAIDDVDHQLLRIRRIGRRLFNVANCVIRFVDLSVMPPNWGRAAISIETAFCRSLPLPKKLTVVADTRNDLTLSQHRLVIESPHVRFYVSCPIYNDAHVVVGSICLVDYEPRSFDEADQKILVDLASLVERELHLRAISASRRDLEKKNKNLRRKSLIDPLLGIWNRGAIMQILNIESMRCAKVGIPIALILADVDFFKKINDTYGHPAGDAVLAGIAGRMRSCIRAQEALGRYGGEEFLVVLPGSSHTTAMAVAERMRLAIAAQPIAIGNLSLNLTISSGVASTDLLSGMTLEQLINHADVALYAAKDAGRNCVMQAKVEAEAETEADKSTDKNTSKKAESEMEDKTEKDPKAVMEKAIQTAIAIETLN